MKRYLIFAGAFFYPMGGMHDFISDWDNISQAIVNAKNQLKEDDWAHVYDIEEKRIVWNSSEGV